MDAGVGWVDFEVAHAGGRNLILFTEVAAGLSFFESILQSFSISFVRRCIFDDRVFDVVGVVEWNAEAFSDVSDNRRGLECVDVPKLYHVPSAVFLLEIFEH
ncbi:hypothetical protein NP274_00092 [Pseudomonas phage Kara-mokiny kep-wari Wadjak 14]|nr:hypothetical protein NP274_00092 [Pseudomonas phage Kara-mokiny kep-wari Wadjak 14]